MSVLDYLADHPREGFTLSELARRLELNKATCHAMFGAMEKYGILLRDPVKKTYTLGPALIRLAEAVAPDEHHALEYARGAMTKLSDEVDLPCVVSGRIGDETVVFARRLPSHYRDRPAPPIGRRIRWAPPIGPTFAAWAPAELQEMWLSRVEPDAPEDQAHYQRVLREIRKRGYDLGLESDARSRLLRAISSLEGTPDARQLREIVDDLLEDMSRGEGSGAGLGRPTTKHMVQSMIAPVFDRAGNVVITLTIDGFPGPLQTREINRYADILLDHAGQVTRAIHGVFPEDWPRPEPLAS
jgi:DNA-binding IclR family transcriptional regulator